MGIYAGCSQPVLQKWALAEDVQGDGSGGYTMNMYGYAIELEHAVDALIGFTAEVSIVAVGLLTIIVKAVKFNLYVDPVAAHIVFSVGFA